MKRNLLDLAIFGAKPAFDNPRHVGQPNIGNRERLLERINDLLDRRWLTNNGPFVQEFEKKITQITGARHCIAMCNATIALEVSTRALGFSGEVIVPSFTFVATAHALQWQEIVPVFCDIDQNSYNIDPGQVERLITPRTTGIIGTHLWGQICDIEALQEIAHKHGLGLLFDAAHAFGCSYQGRMVGNFGDAEVFSFHATKFLNTFEGGAVLTNNDELAQKIRLMKNFGFAGYDNVIFIGTNGKMSEISAAMGLTGLDDMEELIAVNRRNYLRYREELDGIPGIRMLEYELTEKNNFQYIVVEVDPFRVGLTRDQLVDILHAENILARRYFFPGCHRMEPYRSFYPNAYLMLPVTERIVHRMLTLPNGTGVSEEDIREIAAILRTATENAVGINSLMNIEVLDVLTVE